MDSHTQTDTGFDVTPLMRRPSRAAWRRFRAEAIAGVHGEDLAERRWWRRWEFLLSAFGIGVFTVWVPALLLPVEGVSTYTVLGSLAWCATCALGTLFGWWLPRHDCWGPRARRRSRLTAFVTRNGLDYRPEPTGGRIAAHICTTGVKRRHSDRVSTPGAFVVANYKETWDAGDSEGQSNSGYVSFTLRQSLPHSLISRRTRNLPKKLSDVVPVDGPQGLHLWCAKPDYPLLRAVLDTGIVEHALRFGRSAQIEIIGNELFVLTPHGFLPIHSPNLWRTVDEMRGALAPFLAPPPVVGSGELVPTR